MVPSGRIPTIMVRGPPNPTTVDFTATPTICPSFMLNQHSEGCPPTSHVCASDISPPSGSTLEMEAVRIALLVSSIGCLVTAYTPASTAEQISVVPKRQRTMFLRVDFAAIFISSRIFSDGTTY